jgi:hypothetical protein
LWLASLAARIAATLGERAAGTAAATAYRELPALLGLTLVAQGLTIVWRAARVGAPAATG